MTSSTNKRIGVISDTHGHLRDEAISFLQGSDIIIHAGDVGNLDIIDELKNIAPVYPVRGNVDYGATELPYFDIVQAGGMQFYVRHILEELDLDPVAAELTAVIYGHTHEPKAEMINGVLFFNPGSAGPKRFSLPISIGEIRIIDGSLEWELHEIRE